MNGTLVYFGIFVFTVVVLIAGGYLIFGTSSLREAWGRHTEQQQIRERQRAEVYAARQREREFGIQVGIPPNAVLDSATEWMTRAGYGVESRTSNSITFVREKEAKAV